MSLLRFSLACETYSRLLFSDLNSEEKDKEDRRREEEKAVEQKGYLNRFS